MPILRDLSQAERDRLSPYLSTHVDNPVDWWAWCDEAFGQARRRDVPIFLSVGYSSCHWCHVMARESFQDPDVARELNEGFVSIKVDREERPDLDAVYMSATQGLSGQGGWPMSVFLDDQRRPFYAGTYFPPLPRHGLPSFTQVLRGIRAAWTTRRDTVTATGEQVVAALTDREVTLEPGVEASRRANVSVACTSAAARFAGTFDAADGGFGGAPKFPPSTSLEFLVRHGLRVGDDHALSMVTKTCDAMARGGLYDQLGGGFSRYCVDKTWTVPHFEKMLYDNALLLRLYAHVSSVMGSPLATRVCEETVDFLERDLLLADGAFASSLDADALEEVGSNVAVEGASYAWTPEQLVNVLGEDDGMRAAAYLSVTRVGNFSGGRSVLQRWRDPGDSKATSDLSSPDAWWLDVRSRLRSARDERPQPRRDEKVVAAWNGLAICALVDAGRALGRTDWVETAVAVGEYLARVHVQREAGNVRILRTSMGGHVGRNAGVLEDYAGVADGFVSLFLATGDDVWLERAGELVATIVSDFYAQDEGFHDTQSAGEQLIVRPRDPFEQATPSGWAAATAVLLNYATLTADSELMAIGERGLDLLTSLPPESASFLGWLLAAAEAYLSGPVEVVVLDDGQSELAKQALALTKPGMLTVVGEPTGSSGSPLTNRERMGGQPTAYVCRGMVCYEPVTSAGSLAQLLTPGD